MTIFLENQDLNFVSSLTKEVILNEGGREIIKQKIKNEIIDISNNKNLFKINYLTIMVVGLAGARKSTLLNSILKLKGSERAKEGYFGFSTFIIQCFSSRKVPFIRLVDTRGIELGYRYSADSVGYIYEFIEEQLSTNNINNFVHVIWYCISSNKFQKEERELIYKLENFYKDSKMPVIIVLTQSVYKEIKNGMKEYLKKQNFNVINVLARRIDLSNGNFIEAYGLDELIRLTIKVCKNNLNSVIKLEMFSNINKYISNNENIKTLIIQNMISDIFKNDLANKDYSDFNKQKNDFILYCRQYENNIISNEIPNIATKLLDIQAEIEKKKGQAVEMVNKRSYKDFINSTNKFFTDNFKQFYSEFYTNFIMNKIQSSTNFKQELNKVIENLLAEKEIQNLIVECVDRKINDYEQMVYNYISDKKFFDDISCDQHY